MQCPRLTLNGIVVELLMMTLACTSLQATTLVLMSDEDLVHGSTAIVVGQVLSIRTTTESAARIETQIDLVAETQVKGVVSQTLTLMIPGGAARGVRRVVFGVPQFFRGERVLLFLRTRGDGSLTVTGLAMGKYSIVSADTGAMARRQLGGGGTSVAVYDKSSGTSVEGSFNDARPLDGFLEALRQIVADEPPTAAGVPVPTPPAVAGAGHVSDAFSFFGPLPARWTEPGSGAPVGYSVVAAGDATLGFDASMQALREAMAAWSDAGSRLRLMSTGAGPPAPFQACDGVSTIQFNDPFGEIGEVVNCTGILAMGGYCATTASTSTLGGVTFARITEGDLTVNDGFDACPYWNPTTLAEMLTHELGHTIGLAHSSENRQEPNPVLADATMYYMAHCDGRGASLRADDRASVQALYPLRVARRLWHNVRRPAPSHPAHQALPPPVHPQGRLQPIRRPHDQ